MSDTPSKQVVSIEPEYSGESSPEQESDPPIDDKDTDNIDQVITESLADNVQNLSVDSDSDEDNDDASQSTSCETPPQPFELEDDTENSDVEDDMPEAPYNRHPPLSSAQWYACIRQFLSERQREELWNMSPWVDKWRWDDITENGPPPTRLLFTDSIGLF